MLMIIECVGCQVIWQSRRYWRSWIIISFHSLQTGRHSLYISLFFLSFSLSISLFLPLFLSLSLSFSLYLYLSLSILLTLSLSFSLSFSISCFLASLYIYLSLSLSFSLSLSLSLFLSLCLSIFLSLSLSLSLALWPLYTSNSSAFRNSKLLKFSTGRCWRSRTGRSSSAPTLSSSPSQVGFLQIWIKVFYPDRIWQKIFVSGSKKLEFCTVTF